ncbi:MAG: class I SAM-dependent methyltransferase, partial [Anaerolineae bacterium]
AYRLDPEDRETLALFDFAGQFTGKRVLEIGCGNGRLTWRYAEKAAHVTGIDPNADRIERAIQATPENLRGKVDFFASSIDSFVTTKKFDLAIFSWSL